jgi:hypothetical protein
MEYARDRGFPTGYATIYDSANDFFTDHHSIDAEHKKRRLRTKVDARKCRAAKPLLKRA